MDSWGHLLRESLLSPPASLVHSSWLWPWASTAKMDWLVWQHFLPRLATAMALSEWVTPTQLQNFVPFDPATSMAYILWPGQFRQTYRPLFPRSVWHRQMLFPSAITLDLPRTTSYACIHHWSGDNLILAGHYQYQPTILLVAYDPALLQTTSLMDCKHLDWAIRHSWAIGISDGLYMPHRYPALATAAWILADSSASPSLLFSGVFTVTGPLASINAYRVELQGIHALLVALEYFCEQRHIMSGGILIGCDNQRALKQAQEFHEQVPCAHPHADLICAITVL